MTNEDQNEQGEQHAACSSSGRTTPFEGEDPGSNPGRASTLRYRFEPVPGKEHTFLVFDKETGEQINICDKMVMNAAEDEAKKKKFGGH